MTVFKHFCGGAIIGSKLVITAAHCFKFEYPDNTVIRAGDEYLNDPADDATAKDYEINTIANNKDYWGMEYDVALVYTVHPFEFNDRTKKVCIPQAPEDYNDDVMADKSVTLNGWGFENGTFSRQNDSLKEASIQLFSKDFCDGFYPKYNSTIHLCAGNQVSFLYIPIYIVLILIT